jgi:hypothetical protein
LRLPGPLGLPLAALLGPACLLALLLLVYAGLSRVYGRSVAALAAGTLAWVPDLAHWAAMGYADVPLAMYAGAAALYLPLPRRTSACAIRAATCSAPGLAR